MSDRENPKCLMGHEMELLQVASGGWRYGCAKCATSYKVQKKAHYGWLSPIKSTKELAYEAAVKRPMQKPLTVDELMDMPGSVWYENDTVIAPMMVSNRESFSVLYLKDVLFGWYRSSCVDCFASIELPISDYGKTWRCWVEKPTDEERMAAEWEN